MSIAIDSYCLECMLRRHLELVRKLGDEAKAMEFARQWMQLILSFPADTPSPAFGPDTTELLHRMYGLDRDRFRQEKLDSNAFVLRQMDTIRSRIRQAEDPVYAGLQFAILGNYLDFGALQGKVSFDALADMLEKAREITVDPECYDRLCRELSQSKSLLYLTDNAGEIGFDRLFAEELQRRWPGLDITFCVRGGIAANDATREDAAAVGLPFRVIDNGSNVAGTLVPRLGTEARQALEASDVILAKGMANTETLLGCGYNIYYAFLVKCPRFQKLFDKPLMTPMLVRERDTTARHIVI